MSLRLSTIVGLVILAAIYRILPHPVNFSPVLALALFSGCYLSDKKLALLIPFLAMLLSDLVLGFHSTMIFVYAAFALAVGFGMVLKKYFSVAGILIASLLGSFSFYLITNFGVWLMGNFYPATASGLIESYIAGLPFLQNAILGDLFFSGVLFGTVWLLFDKSQPLVASH